jgi:predicted glycogen debranching enzyme
LHDYLCAAQRNHAKTATRDRTLFDESIQAILSGFAAGTRFGIHLDTDGLLACGQTGVQLTWMDAKIGDRVVTPRIGKPVEVQALWLNALKIGGARSARWRDIFQRGAATFEQRFWCESGYLYDVVDCDHQEGAVDTSFRPNQIFAVGGLPYRVLQGPHAREVVEAVEQRLWTPMGLRSLAPGEPGYVGVYHGGVPERDGAYHQGTVWPWLAGPFIEAWVRVHGETAQVKRTARERWLDPLLRHMNAAGLGHLPEIADAEAPYTTRGCPFQAWSVGEALRVRMIVTENSMKGPGR